MRARLPSSNRRNAASTRVCTSSRIAKMNSAVKMRSRVTGKVWGENRDSPPSKKFSRTPLKRNAANALSPKSPQEQERRSRSEKAAEMLRFVRRLGAHVRREPIYFRPLMQQTDSQNENPDSHDRRSYARNGPYLLYDFHTEVLYALWL